MSGYRGLEDATCAALDGGWLRTGDAGYLDAEGFLYISDRATLPAGGGPRGELIFADFESSE